MRLRRRRLLLAAVLEPAVRLAAQLRGLRGRDPNSVEAPLRDVAAFTVAAGVPPRALGPRPRDGGRVA